MIFYESPYRLVKTLAQFAELFGPDREASVSRELTKKFEENVRGTLRELIVHFSAREVKGGDCNRPRRQTPQSETGGCR